MPHLTESEAIALEKAESLVEAAEIAVSVLARMNASGRPIVQICGPLTTGGLGNLEANSARFERAIEIARERGLTVFNQMPFQEAIVRLSKHAYSDEYDMDILEIFYRKIFECGHVATALFLPDWESSRGASWERGVVSSLGIRVEEYPLAWLG